ncbi:MAG: TonB-dependent receptor [Candidatus Eremiobacteraeota bacterium]|nr:TonB-dependent receptor [Candidatus Eremiobacteraeota bacterium]
MSSWHRKAVIVFVCCLAFSMAKAIAETGGLVSGAVTDDRTHAPIAGAQVIVKAPSGTYRTISDSKGNFRFLSVLPDTYSLSVTRTGYLPYSTTVVVLNGSQQNVSVTLSKTLKIIASTHARSSGSAFQRGMTIDTYTVTGSQIQTVMGKSFNANEEDLLRSIPSVTIDKTGTVSIRGGFAFEAAYEFEGIDYTTPSVNLQNTLQNIGNFNLLNGVGSVQLIPGAGDATHGDTGTGLILFTAKNGTYPTYLHVDTEALMYPYLHQLGLEWGWALPSQRLSNYAGFIGVRRAFQYGIPGTAANTLGTLGTNAATLGSTIDPNLVYYAPQFLKSNDFVDNLIYRFGSNENQRLQFFIQSQAITQTLDYGGFQYLPYISGGTTSGKCAPYPIIGPSGPVNSLQQNFACNNLIPLFPGQPNTYAFVSQPDELQSPFLAYKLEYDANISASTLLTTRYFRTYSEQSQIMPAQGIFAQPYGGTRTAGQIDGTTQIGTKNTLKYGTIYEYVVPYGNRYDFTSYTAFTTPPYIVTYGITHPLMPLPLPYTYQGLLPNNNPYAQAGLEQDFFSPAFCAQLNLHNGCGYLSAWFPGGVRFPFEEDVATVAQQQYGTYVQDTIDMSARWKAEAGIRLDGYNFQIPTQAGAPASIPAAEHQRLYEPHFDTSYSPDSRDTFRLGFGHTLAMPLPSLLGADVSRVPYDAFDGIPSYDNSTGKAATYCGPHADSLCSSYADQLYWLTRDYRFGSSTLEAPLVGATFTNVDLSWAHEFHDGSAMKITPFYRRGYNVIEQTAQVIGFNYQTGAPVYGDVQYSNLGIQKAEGIETLYTRELPLGISMQIGATYISQFGNEPPGAFLQPAALAVGEVYRSPDLSPFQLNAAFNWKNDKWRINPVIYANSGYPYGAGYYTAVYCNGIPVIVPNTSLSVIYSQTPGYIDPLDPGTCTKPNIAATRGISEGGLPGGFYTTPRVDANLTVEYRPPTRSIAQSVFGLQVVNLFNELYNVPVINGCYGSPVTTGLSSGTAPCSYGSAPYAPPDLSAHSSAPYLTYPNEAPISFRFYYQVTL